jgi:hypothetical protein
MASTKIDKGLKISIPILVVVVVTVAITTILMNNKSPNIGPELDQETPIANNNEKKNKMAKIYASLNNEKLEINLEENSTTSALVKLLPLDITMNDLNKNEKYAYLDESLPINTYSPKHIEAGDVMLFGDNCLVIFYESFDTSYSYSKIGHINNLPELDDGSIIVNLNAE